MRTVDAVAEESHGLPVPALVGLAGAAAGGRAGAKHARVLHLAELLPRVVVVALRHLRPTTPHRPVVRPDLGNSC